MEVLHTCLSEPGSGGVSAALSDPAALAALVIFAANSQISPGPAPAAPGPAPGPPTPGPAPGLGGVDPFAVVAASPFGGELGETRPAEKPDFTKRLMGVDYYLLSANEALKASFEAAVKAVLAAQVEGGVEPKDVSVKLSPGSVVIDAWFANPQNLSVLTKEKLQQNLCHASNLESELLWAISNLPAFETVATSELYLEKAPQCRTTPREATVAKPSRPSHKAASNITASSSCDPPCLEGRGICGGDSICFCHNPYSGVQCEAEIEDAMPRISWIRVTMLLILVAGFGFLLGECMWNVYTKDLLTGAPRQAATIKTEIWLPDTWISVKPSRHQGH
eukprot:TRINITY_DN18389_c0_g2_i1.p1 TRINITY_DN18389_c0_g2~~TRINITY_DN18389_c0_g2_i1.p1  ORF type:complete len:352 (-),score=59.70 TRINITY_DN18389_c0_g2_i1:185-1189(-)